MVIEESIMPFTSPFLLFSTLTDGANSRITPLFSTALPTLLTLSLSLFYLPITADTHLERIIPSLSLALW